MRSKAHLILIDPLAQNENYIAYPRQEIFCCGHHIFLYSKGEGRLSPNQLHV